MSYFNKKYKQKDTTPSYAYDKPDCCGFESKMKKLDYQKVCAGCKFLIDCLYIQGQRIKNNSSWR